MRTQEIYSTGRGVNGRRRQTFGPAIRDCDPVAFAATAPRMLWGKSYGRDEARRQLSGGIGAEFVRKADPEGHIAGTINGDCVYDHDSKLVATTVGNAPAAARGGAVLLLILNRWFLADGTPNPDVQ